MRLNLLFADSSLYNLADLSNQILDIDFRYNIMFYLLSLSNCLDYYIFNQIKDVELYKKLLDKETELLPV